MVLGSEFGNCGPVEGGETTSSAVVVGLVVVCIVEAGVSSGEAGFEGILGDRNVTTELVERSKPEGVKGWRSSSGSERTERKSSQGGKIECIAA